MNDWIQEIKLYGKHITLLPLSMQYHDDLVEAVQDRELWKLWFTSVASPEKMRDEINKRLDWFAKGEMIPFVVIDNLSNKAIGMTAFYRLDIASKHLEIGYTWYRKQMQKTLVNAECKLLLLQYAFEELGCVRVEFRTHQFNFTSQRAIVGLGAKLDGVLRNYRTMSNGVVADGHVYSIISNEWSIVKVNLLYRLKNN